MTLDEIEIISARILRTQRDLQFTGNISIKIDMFRGGFSGMKINTEYSIQDNKKVDKEK